MAGTFIAGDGFSSRAGLHCSECSFDVARFEGYRWRRSVDYLWFRNHFKGRGVCETSVKSNAETLEGALERDAACSAYCCQCSWQSVSAPKVLQSWGTVAAPEGGAAGGTLKWMAVRR
jgi:hypothetical protein